MISLALIVAGASLAVSLAVAWTLRLVGRIALQLAGLALLCVVVPLGAVLLSGWVMFHMGDDVKILAVAAGSATAAVVAGLLLARATARPLRDLTLVAGRISGGDLSARAPATGAQELRTLAHSFNTMAEAVESLFDARRELVSWASHDLRTPLASLRAIVEAAEDGLVDPRESLPTIREQVDALSVLVDDLFELAQIDAGALTLELQRVRLGDVVTSALRVIAPVAARSGVKLETVETDAVVIAAPDKLERVLQNIVVNALRYTPRDGAVAVRVEDDATEVVVHVEDTGEGLTGDTAARMFDRFWRADRARSRNGSGLGLAIAKGIVEAHGGRIWAENRAQGGARVSFALRPAP